MMNSMTSFPYIIRCERQDADRTAHPVVGDLPLEQGTVATVMLNKEKPY